MGTLKKLLIKIQSYLVNFLSSDGISHQSMSLFGVSVSTLFLSLFSPIHRLFSFFRLQSSKTEESDSDMTEIKHKEKDETESPKLVFKFEYQTETFEQFSKSFRDSVSSLTAKKYEFSPLKDLRGFIQKPEDMSCSVKELFSDSVNVSCDDSEDLKNRVLAEEGFLQENYVLEKAEDSDSVMDESFLEKAEDSDSVLDEIKDSKLEKDEAEEKELSSDDPTVSGKIQFLSEKNFFDADSGSDSGQNDEYFSRFLGLKSDGFVSDSDFEDEFFTDSQTWECSSTLSSEMLSEGDFVKTSTSERQNSETTHQSMDIDDDEEDDESGLESLWEHQDLIEQLKMEMKKAKAAIGLPTILEESECPRLMEDLKPWKMDEYKFQHHDQMGELRKFYKSYRERMRKFDILNYQKQYAIGLLQSKGSLEAISKHKSSQTSATIVSILPENLRSWLQRKPETGPVENFIKELYVDLETVYVGQLCLSWEILHWQYQKAIEIWESDRYNVRRYNEVAGEFQQFQVLMQRFLEDEPFEGPRVQNYVEKRRVLRNFLQVPVIREDSNKDKKAVRRRGGEDDGAITSDNLVEIMEESIRLFWQFVRSDKHANSTFEKRRKGTRIEPEESQDLEMLAEIKSTLQKKEKRLKDALRCGSCILRRLQKREEDDGSDQVLYFFSQVDMKLVARVLNMSKITKEHVVWCQDKLSRISFVSRRKIHVEPSFSLFPC